MLKRVVVMPTRGGVRVVGFSPAARGAEVVIGKFECDLVNLKQLLMDPGAQELLGIDKAPAGRTRSNPSNEPVVGGN